MAKRAALLAGNLVIYTSRHMASIAGGWKSATPEFSSWMANPLPVLLVWSPHAGWFASRCVAALQRVPSSAVNKMWTSPLSGAVLSPLLLNCWGPAVAPGQDAAGSRMAGGWFWFWCAVPGRFWPAVLCGYSAVGCCIWVQRGAGWRWLGECKAVVNVTLTLCPRVGSPILPPHSLRRLGICSGRFTHICLA